MNDPNRKDRNAADGSVRRDFAVPRDLTLLRKDADALINRLVRLRHNLSEARRDLHGMQSSSPLAKANDQLILVALSAENIAETAVTKLGELARSSQHDPLTGLPNRLLMLDRLENAIAMARRHDTQFALLFLDLDKFKRINDTMGHTTGDQVLQLVARRLQSAVRESDTVSRHGGEEFLILLPQIFQASDAALIAENVESALSAPSHAGDYKLNLSASIGISIYPADGNDPETLIGRADAAMYRAKGRGPGLVEFFAENASMPEHNGTSSSSRTCGNESDTRLNIPTTNNA